MTIVRHAAPGSKSADGQSQKKARNEMDEVMRGRARRLILSLIEKDAAERDRNLVAAKERIARGEFEHLPDYEDDVAVGKAAVALYGLMHFEIRTAADKLRRASNVLVGARELAERMENLVD